MKNTIIEVLSNMKKDYESAIIEGGRYADSEKLLKSEETWLKEYIFSYFENIVFATFEKHLKKILEWKKNPDEFIKELVNQDTENTLHETIKDKMGVIL